MNASVRYAQSFSIYRTIDRHRIESWVGRIIESGGLNTSHIFLDVGCGVGRFTLPLARHVRRSFGLDSDLEMIKMAQAVAFSKIRWLCASANAIPLDSNSIDGVLSSMLLEHVTDRDKVFLEISRVLRDGGRFVIRTMLPEDIRRTSWYEFVPSAADFELSRTIPLAEIEELSARSGFRFVSSRSYTDEVEPSVAKLLPERIYNQSYEILKHIDTDTLVLAARRAAAAVDSPAYKEYMASSLVFLIKVEQHV